MPMAVDKGLFKISLALLVLVLAVLVVLRSQPDGPRPAPPPAVDLATAPPPSPVDAAVPPEGPATTDVQRLLCGTRQPCKIVESKDSFSDPAGLRWSVYSITLRTSDPAQQEGACRGESEPLEYWLVSHNGQQVQTSQLLLSLCNDGYGAAGIGVDTVTVDRNRFSHQRTGGSAWRWTVTTELQLAPLQLAQIDRLEYSEELPNREETHWNWPSFKGFKAWEGIPCEPAARANKTVRYEFRYIPQVQLDEAFIEQGWKSAELAACSLEVDGSAASGYAWSKPAAGGRASLRATVSAGRSRYLFVQILDDRVVGRSEGGRLHDTLELWLGGRLPGFSDECARGGAALTHYSIDLADGRAEAKQPAPQLQIELDRSARQTPDDAGRLKIKLPDEARSLAISFSDTDDGETPAAALGTTKERPASAAALGELQPIGPKQATCVVQDGRLTPVLTPIPARRSEAVVGDL